MIPCVSCGNTLLSDFRIIDGHMLKLCSQCGLLVTQTSDEERRKYVNNKYTHQYARDYVQGLPKLYHRFEKHLSLLKRHNTGGKLLDVGCGTGHFLKYVRETDRSWQVYGVEPNRLLRSVATKSSGVAIKNGTLNVIPFSDNYFDVITCYDVLEHSTELKKNIRELKRVLKPQGLLFIQAPNYRSLMARLTGDRWDWWCIPDHMLHFSYDFLLTYVRKNGFTILESYTYEDQEDYLFNIKGIFSKNYLTKATFYFLVPFFLLIEQIARVTHNGGLTVVIARK